MEKLKIAFVGLGSIGKRHLDNLRLCLKERGQDFSLDLYRSGHGKELDTDTAAAVSRVIPFESGMTVSESYDAVFITNPTSMHYETLRCFSGSARAFFIEKPLFDSADADLATLNLPSDTAFYVAAPLRYHPVIEYVRNNLPCEKAVAVRAICSSYLPDWRPGTDYRKCYSAHRDMGGGVGIDLIHEWDYLSLLFGEITSGVCVCGRFSELEIDSDDLAVYIGKTENAVIELHLDYFGRKSIRQMQIFLPDETVECDLLNGTVSFSSTNSVVTLDCRRDTYQQSEIRHFLNILDGKIASDNDLAHALRVLKYARGEF